MMRCMGERARERVRWRWGILSEGLFQRACGDEEGISSEGGFDAQAGMKREGGYGAGGLVW